MRHFLKIPLPFFTGRAEYTKTTFPTDKHMLSFEDLTIDSKSGPSAAIWSKTITASKIFFLNEGQKVWRDSFWTVSTLQFGWNFIYGSCSK